ncbi:glutathione S-transferase family protein [Halomonas sp. PA16-9]|uniref:glutathione S-transferase family protein n=2 Tax=Halomonas TaxID=2745 RepID=UPI0030EEBE7E
MNPTGLVPLLKDDATNSVLWESNTIIRYLAAQYGQSKLWIEAPAERAQAEKWMDWSNSTLSPRHRTILMGYVRTPPEKRDNVALEVGMQACEELFELMENVLAKQTFFSGNEFGLGDIAVAPFIYNLWHIGLTWQPRPNLERWYQQIAERPTYQKVVVIPVT